MRLDKYHCCKGISSYLENKDQKGFSILAYNGEILKGFRLLYRSFSKEDEITLLSKDTWREFCDQNFSKQIEVNISGSVAVSRCPACGCKLEKLLRKNKVSFEELAKYDEKYIV